MRITSVLTRTSRGRADDAGDSNDDGFTLIEVLIAIAILIAVCTTTLPFLVSEKHTAALFQHELVATTMASTALEAVAAQSASVSTTTNLTNLVTGRAASDVTAAWSANSSVAGVGATYPLSDPTATNSNGALVPISGATSVVNGTSYTTSTLIGACYMPTATLTGASCGRIAGVTNVPASAPNGYIGMIRVIVVTSWSGDAACATSGSCQYSASTLINIDPDLTWVN